MPPLMYVITTLRLSKLVQLYYVKPLVSYSFLIDFYEKSLA